MNKIRPILLALTVVFAALLAYGVWTRPSARPADHDGFSAARVIKDIEVMSKEHHSVAHPEERAKVREYLMQRLEGLGADTVMLYEYDSLVGPKNKHVVYTFDAKNIVAEFPPLEASADPTYLLMVAHYDSRYSQPMPKDTVWSYGAADDGYGVGVILETVSQVLKNRQDWKQGVKVLFTDAEEVGMMGMKAAWDNDKQIFDNVGLVLNVEARGPKGPALLFEACPGNDKVQDLYASCAKYPYTYSLTTVVYGFMPTYTDFSIIKDSVPGLNFSTIADINHYHTDLDNIHNISEKTIQHYGEQIMPLMKEYLTNKEYAEKNYFLAEEDVIYFSIPLLGTFHFPKNTYWLLNIGVFFLLLHLMFKQNNLPWKTILKPSGITIALGLGWIVVGEVIAWLSALSVGARFKLFGTVQGIPFDNAVILLSVLILVVGMVRFVQNLYASLFTLMLLSFIALIIAGENMMFFIPLCIGTLSVMLWQATSSRIFPLLGVCLILLHAFSFVYIIAMALTIGALGLVLLVAFCHLIVVIPLAKLYLADKASSRMP